MDIEVRSIIGKANKSNKKVIYNDNVLPSKEINGVTLIKVDTLVDLGASRIWDTKNKEILVKYLTDKQQIDMLPDLSNKIDIRRYSKNDYINHYIHIDKDLIPKVYGITIVDYDNLFKGNSYLSDSINNPYEIKRDTFIYKDINNINKCVYILVDEDKKPIGYSIEEGLSKRDGSFGIISIELEVTNKNFEIKNGVNFEFIIRTNDLGYYKMEEFESDLEKITNNQDKSTFNFHKDFKILYLKNRDYSIGTQILNHNNVIKINSAKIIEIK